MKLRKLICIGLSLAMLASGAGCAASSQGTSAAGSTPTAEASADAADGEAAAGAEGSQNTEAPGDTAKADEEAASGSTGTPAENSDSSQAEISPEDISVTWEDSRVYGDLSLGRYSTITTYGVKGYEDVPFISAEIYLDILFEGKQRIAIEDGVMKISVNGTQAVIDPSADTILFEDASKFRSRGVVNGGIVDSREMNVITASSKNESLQTDALPLTISLRDYHMPVIPYEDTILMPFLALQNTFGSIRMVNQLAYNGKDYYNAVSVYSYKVTEGGEEVEESPYLKAYYSGPFSEKKETTQAYADYGYYSICLLLDLTFGHKEEKNITTFDDYFTRMNAKEAMCSTDPSSAVLAETLLFNYLFDSGHDTVISTNTVFGRIEVPDKEEVESVVDDIRKSEEGRELFEEAQETVLDKDKFDEDVILGALMEKGFKIPEVAPLYAWSIFFNQVKPEDYGSERVDYVGDTAVIYFNAFKDDTTVREPSYYVDPVKKEDEATSNFAFFYNAFKDIKEHDEVKNIVINISDNGGGNASGLVSVLGFLSKDGEVKITDKDLVSGSYREECYHIDTNLDGIADDQDGFGGQYDFYIMCSGSSYSCANALPYFAQKNGLATIIGTNPGGGDCVVGTFIDAYGRCAFYSGMLKLGTDEGNGFVSNEKATKVDFNMMPNIWDIVNVPWFNPEGIADAVHQYQAGSREITYSDETNEENISKLMMNLFEKIAVFTGIDASDSGETGAAAEAADSGATGAAAEAADSGATGAADTAADSGEAAAGEPAEQ